MKYVTPLNDAEIETLRQMHAYHPSRRARMRAHSLLLSHQRYPHPTDGPPLAGRPAARVGLDGALADLGVRRCI